MERTVSYGIGGGLTDGHLTRLHETALRILSEIGVEVSSDRIRKRIAGQSGVGIDGTRVRLSPEVVDRLLVEHRAALNPPALPGDAFFVDMADGYCFEWLDPDTDALKTMTTADCIRWAKLVDSLYGRGVRGGNPGMPQDVPAELRELMTYKISLQHCRAPSWPAFTSARNGEVMLQMAEVAGHGIGLSVFVLDPLRVEGPTIDMALDYLERKVKATLAVSSMPMAGVTAPILMAGAYAESVATNLGAFAIFKLLGADIGISPTVFPFDMRYGSIAYGTPEHVQSFLLSNQISAYYNRGQMPWFCPAFETNSVAPDAHSLSTRAAFAVVGALAGARHFGFAGWLGIDKIFSPEQLILDIELVEYLRCLVRPIPFSEEALGFEVVREVGPGGGFLTHPSTMQHCRDQWTSSLFKSQSPEQRQAQPYRVKDEAREMVRQAEAAYQRPVDVAVAQEVERIYRRAAAG